MLPKENYRVKTMSFGFFLEVRRGGGEAEEMYTTKDTYAAHVNIFAVRKHKHKHAQGPTWRG